IFVFSSRRRHTRSYGDWSSDVCSSDLPMTRRVLLSFSFLAALALVGFAQPPAAKPEAKVKSTLKVTVPQEDAELTIEKTVMKTKIGRASCGKEGRGRVARVLEERE